MKGHPSSLATSADYAEWLSWKHWNWSHWWTGTFGNWVPSEQAAIRCWRRAAGRLPEGAAWFCCVERGDLFGRTHLHALVSTTDPWALEEFWRDVYGLTWLRDYRIAGGAVTYAAKYCTKEMTLWDLRHPHVSEATLQRETGSLPPSPAAASFIRGGANCSSSSSITRRNRESLPRVLSRREGLTQSNWPCGSVGIEVIEKDSPTVLRTPRDLRTFLTKTVSVGPSTSGIHASGVTGSEDGSKTISHGQRGAGSGCRRMSITSRLRMTPPGNRLSLGESS